MSPDLPDTVATGTVEADLRAIERRLRAADLQETILLALIESVRPFGCSRRKFKRWIATVVESMSRTGPDATTANELERRSLGVLHALR
ncbi:hypothetical protein MPOCJGCO_1200 [Methylobacterium trifolii]|uniref:Uncharacterized protein n=1 Tax=Methylobacterium trifolii TaxID=1003092 RepID=A0ABQ4TV02_9HYPH|nr:hypothetical protein MPOCJGCO_1200 [Methylobacterium trifolii]